MLDSTLIRQIKLQLLKPVPLLLVHTEPGFEQFRVAEKAHGSWMKLYLEGNTSEVLANMGKKVLKQYLDALNAMSSALGKQLGRYDMYSMIAGMVVVFQVSAQEVLLSLNIGKHMQHILSKCT